MMEVSNACFNWTLRLPSSPSAVLTMTRSSDICKLASLLVMSQSVKENTRQGRKDVQRGTRKSRRNIETQKTLLTELLTYGSRPSSEARLVSLNIWYFMHSRYGILQPEVTGNCFGLNAVTNEDLPPVTPPDPPKVTDVPLKKSFEFGSRWGGQECDARLQKMKGPHSCTSEVVDQMPPEGKALMEAFHKCSGAFRIYPMDQGSKKAFAEPNVTRTFAGSYHVDCHYPVDLTCNTSFGEFPNSCSGTLILTPSRNGVVHPQVPFYMAFYAYSNFKTLNGHAEKIDPAWSHAAFETQVVASKSVICRGTYKLESGKCFGLTENQVNTALYPGPAMSPPMPPEIPSMLYPFPEVEAHFPADDAGPRKSSRSAGYGWWIFIVLVMIIMVLGAFLLRRRRKIREEERLQLQSNQF